MVRNPLAQDYGLVRTLRQKIGHGSGARPLGDTSETTDSQIGRAPIFRGSIPRSISPVDGLQCTHGF